MLLSSMCSDPPELASCPCLVCAQSPTAWLHALVFYVFRPPRAGSVSGMDRRTPSSISRDSSPVPQPSRAGWKKRRVAPFFVRRWTSLNSSVLTPSWTLLDSRRRGKFREVWGWVGGGSGSGVMFIFCSVKLIVLNFLQIIICTLLSWTLWQAARYCLGATLDDQL